MTKKKDNRSNEILNILSRDGKVEVTALSAQLSVSQVTIRKDLDTLEEKGLVRRSHGYAMLNDSDDISARLAYHYEEKTKIARAGAQLVHDGDTVMIESGSCCALLAQILATEKQNITIVTNSVFIADYIRSSGNCQVVLTGGMYQPDSQCLIGPMVKESASNYHVQYFFIGTDGWSNKTGFTNKDQFRTQAVRDMAASCEEVVILTESLKFKQAGTVPLNIKNQPRILLTDQNIDPAVAADLKSDGIQIITV